MAIYIHHCDKCKKHIEIDYSMSFVGNETALPKITLKKIKCHHGIMPRVPQLPYLIGAKGSEKKLLKDKQAQRKYRSKAHFKNEILPTLKDPVDRGYFKNKFTKGANKHIKGNHEKM